MQLFYDPHINGNATEFTFSPQESKHMIRVLRKRVDDLIYITNGNGYLFTTKILEADAKKCRVGIVSALQSERKPYRLHMAVAPTKMNDRFEWFLEKATEIGVTEITPLICENSERKTVKPERLEKVVQAAMKQSLQTYLPRINISTSFTDFMRNPLSHFSGIAHCEDGAKTLFHNMVAPQKDVTVLIGPEGDFSAKEIDLALKKGYAPVSLGNNRLRTETAAVFACMAVAIVNS
ncbi:16S rRNA (uracil(1498)-N(3))-methyltransferase [Arenibacter sp. GZD96]|uniref:16S rRNA (uracil(1498)-N(3))-methyltransferase n=1 Tax=Aurantibrevibacter litoralis TaxID=3106030 RepID=UPI002AFF6FD3|nr:16S rRNA (uracil(1498)-N(3))-methyltransferase [Arenibacter sp. GZD-96]MEA1787409.1 16S rRNA (uracil(1498)-N(3))-methyltransferase [Arenibacter sp. GZD-96]